MRARLIESPLRSLHSRSGRQARNFVRIGGCECVRIEHYRIARCGGHTLEMRCGVDSQNFFVCRSPGRDDLPAACRELTGDSVEDMRALDPFWMPRRRDVFRELS